MELYLLRHAIAIDRGTEGYLGNADDRRPLTAEGLKKMTEAARGIQHLGLSFDEILSSPLPRAWETARIVARAIRGESRLIECPELVPEAPLSKTIDLLELRKDKASILLVGHEPSLSRLATHLLQGGSSEFLEFKKGGMAKLELEFARGHARSRLVWLVTPRILRSIGE
jgi:phosphohistidine phosphatase